MGPPSLLSNGYQGREPDHSPTSNAEVKMRDAIPQLFQYAIMAWLPVKEVK